MIYGYCRISTNKQSIERQIRNIKALYKDVIIYQEVYTGTSTDRKQWNQLLRKVKQGDTIVFDSVSRMSRDATDGFELYQLLFNKEIELIFLKEPHINTSTYKSALNSKIALTGKKEDILLKAINEYLLELAKEQIKIAFQQAEKEVTDLHQRTKEGIETARLNGKQIGLPKGTKLTTKKSIETKQKILRYSKDFDGSLSDVDCIALLGVARNTYYKYKKELRA